MTRNATWLLVLLSSVACAEGVSEASRIEYARVLGVRIEAASDPQRNAVSVEEAARARVLVVGPDGATEVSYAILLCAADAPDGTLPGCKGPALATALGEAESEPTVAWSGLSVDDLGGADGLLVAGTICEAGTPGTDASRPGHCEGTDAPGVSFVAHVPRRDADDPATENQHPRATDALVTFDGEAWPAGMCGAQAARDHEEHDLTVTLHDSNRESVTGDNGDNEQLLLSWFTTDGNLDRHFSVLERDAAEDTPLDALWTSPKSTSDATRNVATFYFVLRDQRGGIDWIERTLCLE